MCLGIYHYGWGNLDQEKSTKLYGRGCRWGWTLITRLVGGYSFAVLKLKMEVDACC